jgi:hypothetical protein
MVSNIRGCVLKAHHSPLLATVVSSFLTLWGFQPFALGSPQTRDTKKKQIEVRLIPKKKTIKVGEALEVRVEIWNVSSKSLFIRKAVYELCQLSPLSLRLELGPPMKPQPGHGCSDDCIYDAKDSFATRLAYQWTILPAGDFFGTVVTMDADTFPQLNTSGRWRLRGTYESTGDLSLALCFNTAPIHDEKEQIKGLPYEAWQGAVDTNTIWIEVVRTRSSAMGRKSP